MSREVFLLKSAIEAIGSTPLVELSRLTAKLGLDGRILAKLDFLNPGFSKKDRRPSAGANGRRADQRQYGDRAGHCLRDKRLSFCGHYIPGQFQGESPHDGGPGSGGCAG